MSRSMNISDEIEAIKSMHISYVDPATIPDGEYTGEFPFNQLSFLLPLLPPVLYNVDRSVKPFL